MISTAGIFRLPPNTENSYLHRQVHEEPLLSRTAECAQRGTWMSRQTSWDAGKQLATNGPQDERPSTAAAKNEEQSEPQHAGTSL